MTLEIVVGAVVVFVLGFAVGATWMERKVERYKRMLSALHGRIGSPPSDRMRFVGETDAAFTRRVGRYHGGSS